MSPLCLPAKKDSLKFALEFMFSKAELYVREEVSTFFLSNYILVCTAPKLPSVFEFLLGMANMCCIC